MGLIIRIACVALAMATDSGDAHLHAVLDGYQANAARVDHVRIESEYAIGSAKTLDDAIDPNFHAERIGKGIYVRDGENKKIAMHFPESMHDSFPSLESTWHGDVTLQFYPAQRLALIDKYALSPFYGAADPFDLGTSGPKGVDAIDALLRRAIEKRAIEELSVSQSTVDGRKCWHVAFDDVFTPSRRRSHTIDFDPAHGFLPIAQAVELNGRRVLALRVADFHHLADGGWIPRRVAIGERRGGERRGRSNSPTLVHVSVITFAEPQKIDANAKTGAFALTLGDGIQVNDVIGKLSWRTGRGMPTSIDLATYDREAISKSLAAEQAAMNPTSAAPAAWWKSPLLFIVVAVVLLAALYWISTKHG
jgi:hypothetical protein